MKKKSPLSEYSDELKAVGIINIPQFFQISKQVLTNAIATFAVVNREEIQGEEDWQTQIMQLKQLRKFLKILEDQEKEKRPPI